MIKYSDSNVGSEKHWRRVGFGPRLMFKARLLQYPLQTWNGLTLFIWWLQGPQEITIIAIETVKEIGSDDGRETDGNGKEEGFDPSTFPDAKCVGAEEEEGEAKRTAREVREGQAERRQKENGLSSSMEKEVGQGGEQPLLPIFANLNQDYMFNNMIYLCWTYLEKDSWQLDKDSVSSVHSADSDQIDEADMLLLRLANLN